MSSRYRNDYYDNEPAAYNGSARSPRSPKSRSRQSSTRRGPYGMSLGRKGRSSARWEPKSPPRKTDDEKKGEFNQEDVEKELNHYKKGVFYFDETLKPSNDASLSNGHGTASKAKVEHEQFQLILSDKPPPANVSKSQLRGSEKKSADDSKDSSPADAVSDSKKKKKRRKAVVVTQQPSRRDRRSARVQPIVTISPQRTVHGPSPYGAFAAPRADYRASPYYASGYPYGAPNAAPSYYDLYPPNAAGFMARGPPNAPSNGALSHPNDYSYLANAPGTMGEDGLWYPFPEAQQKKAKKSRKGGGGDGKALSPGRRVNKIQKQLEYYFSPANLDEDEFLREAMDGDGWVDIDVLIPFARMKVLGATKELVIEAAFHSTVIEIEHVKQQKVRMTAQWREYVKQKKEKKKERAKSTKEREREKLIQRELDNAEVTESTIDAIVALVEKKQERRAKRREEREREKAKRKQNAKDAKSNNEKGKEKEKEEKKTEVEVEEDTKTTKSEATEELIEQDKAKHSNDADSKGDPDNNDMVEID